MYELVAQHPVHLIDELIGDVGHPVGLGLGLTHDKAVHALSDGIQGFFHGGYDALADPRLHIGGHVPKQRRPILGLNDHLHIVLQGFLHHQVGKGVGKIINGAGGAAVSHAVEHIKKQGTGNTGNGSHEGEGHAPDHLGNAVHGFGCVAHVQAAQAPHEPNKSTQNTQAGEQAGNHIRQLGVTHGIDHRFVVNIIFHVAVQAPGVQLLGVHQKAPPGPLDFFP